MAETVHRRGHLLTLVRLVREQTPLLDDRACHGMREIAGRQDQLADLADTNLLQPIDRLQLDLDRKAGPGMRCQIKIGGVIQLGRPFRRLDQLEALDIVRPARAAQMERNAADAVVIFRFEGKAHHLAFGHARLVGKGDGRWLILDHVHQPGAEHVIAIGNFEFAGALQYGAGFRHFARRPGRTAPPPRRG